MFFLKIIKIFKNDINLVYYLEIYKKQNKMEYKVKHSYTASRSTELSLESGEIIRVI